MDLLTRDDVNALLAAPRPPCVSVYMATHRGGGEEDPIRWKLLLKEAEDRLMTAGLRPPEARKLLDAGIRLLEDTSFWGKQCDGLAFFVAPQFLRFYRLPVPFADLVVVGPRFQVVPLLSLLAGDGRFYVLALSQNAVRLLHGTRYGVSEVDLKGVPRSLSEALLTHDRDEPLTFHSRPTPAGGWGAIFGGHGVGIDDEKDDLLRYFKRIDRGLHPTLREERSPLVLAGAGYLLPIYRQANTYPHLVERGIEGNPDRLKSAELHERAWAIVQPSFEEARTRALARYRRLAGTGYTASFLEDVVRAAHEGQVKTLFLASDRQRWGRFDAITERVQERDQPQAGDEDLLNLTAADTLRHGGEVYLVDSAQVPGGGLLAGVFHPPMAKHGKRP